MAAEMPSERARLLGRSAGGRASWVAGSAGHPSPGDTTVSAPEYSPFCRVALDVLCTIPERGGVESSWVVRVYHNIADETIQDINSVDIGGGSRPGGRRCRTAVCAACAVSRP